MSFLRAVKFWIVLSTLASVAGWLLSVIGMLNQTGYVLFAAIILAFLLSKWRAWGPLSPAPALKKLRRRLRRFLPAGFAILAALVFVSGVIHAPNGHTALSYRIPRVLNWLQHGHWFWIHTPNYRMNDRACGIEWLSAPLLLFWKSDRALFLFNFIPFVLMPGLIFSIWTRLGVKARVAWNWMWLVPTGYCFLLQAGGIANDAFPTVYALAMVDFALRAWERGARMEDGEWKVNLGYSLLSAALLVGAKASNLPLGLPWAIVFFPLLPRLWRGGKSSRAPRSALGIRSSLFNFARWVLIGLVALVVSFVPTAILNIHYLHDWSGLSIEHAGMNMKNPIAGILGNAVLLVTNNFVPTFFPAAHWWSTHALSYFPGWLARLMNANFEGGYNILLELPTEDWSGIGFGISVLLVVSMVAALAGPRIANRGSRNTELALPLVLRRAALVAPWIALLAYCMKTGMVTPARLIAPYYPFLFPLLLVGASQSQVVRRGWWRVMAGGVLALALAALVLTPPRPLWPAQTILSKMATAHPDSTLFRRAQKVYEVYGHRADPMAGIRGWFPPDLKVIGFMGTDDDLDISFWKPYGSRRVEPFFYESSPEEIRQLGIQYAVVSGMNLNVNNATIETWLQTSGAELIASTNVTLTVSQGPEPWYFVRFKP